MITLSLSLYNYANSDTAHNCYKVFVVVCLMIRSCKHVILCSSVDRQTTNKYSQAKRRRRDEPDENQGRPTRISAIHAHHHSPVEPPIITCFLTFSRACIFIYSFNEHREHELFSCSLVVNTQRKTVGHCLLQ